MFAGANATILAGQTYTYRGSFGDNSTDQVTGRPSTTAMAATLNPCWSTRSAPKPYGDEGYALTAIGYFELTHVYDQAGPTTSLVTMTDSSDLSSSTTLIVYVVPAPPRIDDTGITLRARVEPDGHLDAAAPSRSSTTRSCSRAPSRIPTPRHAHRQS